MDGWVQEGVAFRDRVGIIILVFFGEVRCPPSRPSPWKGAKCECFWAESMFYGRSAAWFKLQLQRKKKFCLLKNAGEFNTNNGKRIGHR